jgi:protocatechuate 3,4-dioxygenase beta subunit
MTDKKLSTTLSSRRDALGYLGLALVGCGTDAIGGGNGGASGIGGAGASGIGGAGASGMGGAGVGGTVASLGAGSGGVPNNGGSGGQAGGSAGAAGDETVAGGAAGEAAGGSAGAAAGSGGSGGASALSCVVKPEQTEGPYFLDERLNRSDIRSDPADGNKVRPGVALSITLRVYRVDGQACLPIAGALIDIWQCDADGVYSDVVDVSGQFDTRGKKFLRGYQLTGADGKADFVTIYPGWYPGRTVHVHFKVRTNPDTASGHVFTSQLYFTDATSDEVFKTTPYSSRAARTTKNAQDSIFLGGGDKLILSVTPDGAGYTSSFDLGLNLT